MLQQLIGSTKNKKVIDESYKIYLEEFQKRFPNYFEKNYSKAFALVTVTKEKEILDIGMSKVDDILNDNWGNFMRMFLSGDSSQNAIYKDTTGNFAQLKIWGTPSSRLFNTTNIGGVGTTIATGSGVTPATRQDFNIEIAKNSGSTGDGGWNSGLGKIDIPFVATATTAYSLTETCLFGSWRTVADGIKGFVLSRDNISPVSVIIGQTINVDYQLLLS